MSLSTFILFGHYGELAEVPKDGLPAKFEDGYMTLREIDDPDLSGLKIVQHFLTGHRSRDGLQLQTLVLDIRARTEKLSELYREYTDDAYCHPSQYTWFEQEALFVVEDEEVTTITGSELLNFDYDKPARIVMPNGSFSDCPHGWTYRQHLPSAFFDLLKKIEEEKADFVLFAYV